MGIVRDIEEDPKYAAACCCFCCLVITVGVILVWPSGQGPMEKAMENWKAFEPSAPSQGIFKLSLEEGFEWVERRGGEKRCELAVRLVVDADIGCINQDAHGYTGVGYQREVSGSTHAICPDGASTANDTTLVCPFGCYENMKSALRTCAMTIEDFEPAAKADIMDIMPACLSVAAQSIEFDFADGNMPLIFDGIDHGAQERVAIVEEYLPPILLVILCCTGPCVGMLAMCSGKMPAEAQDLDLCKVLARHVLLATFLTIFSLTIHIAARPFEDTGTDWTEMLSLWAQLITLVAGPVFVILNDPESGMGPGTASRFRAVLELAGGLTLATALGMSVLVQVRVARCQKRRRRRRAR